MTSTRPMPRMSPFIYGEYRMSNNTTYKLVQIVGTSSDSVEGAVRNGVSKASATLRGMEWFQVDEIRGRIDGGDVKEFQVVMRVGFRLDD